MLRISRKPYIYPIIVNKHKTFYNIMIFNYIFFILTSVHNVKHTRGIFGEGGEGTCVEILSKFSALCRSIFSKKWSFFGNFRDTSTQITPKSTFYCFFIKKFPQNLQKSAQKFFAAPSAPKTCRNISIF